MLLRPVAPQLPTREELADALAWGLMAVGDGVMRVYEELEDQGVKSATPAQLFKGMDPDVARHALEPLLNLVPQVAPDAVELVMPVRQALDGVRALVAEAIADTKTQIPVGDDDFALEPYLDSRIKPLVEPLLALGERIAGE